MPPRGCHESLSAHHGELMTAIKNNAEENASSRHHAVLGLIDFHENEVVSQTFQNKDDSF